VAQEAVMIRPLLHFVTHATVLILAWLGNLHRLLDRYFCFLQGRLAGSYCPARASRFFEMPRKQMNVRFQAKAFNAAS